LVNQQCLNLKKNSTKYLQCLLASLDNPLNEFQEIWMNYRYVWWVNANWNSSNQITWNLFRGLSRETRGHYKYFVELYDNYWRQKINNTNTNLLLLKARHIIPSESAIMLSLGFLWHDVTHGGTDLQPNNKVSLPPWGSCHIMEYCFFVRAGTTSI